MNAELIHTGAGVLLTLALAAPAQKPAPRAKAHPLAQALCDALHTLPAARKRECCGRPSPSLAAVCVQELSASLGRGAVAIDRAAVARCAQDSARLLQGCDWVTPLSPPAPPACRSVIAGTLASGAACRSSLECADGLSCRGVRPDRAGVCAKPAAAHARCEAPADNLAAFTGFREDPRHPVCDGLCVKGRCVAFSPAGGACQSSAQCTQGLSCIAGRCQDLPLPGVGESCAGGTSCAAGAFCQAGRCAAAKAAGEACASPMECRAFQCAVAPGAKSGTCADPCGPAAGAAAKPSAR